MDLARIRRDQGRYGEVNALVKREEKGNKDA